jgi:hypothetical protein
MENSFIKKIDSNGLTHYVNPTYEKIFDGEETIDTTVENPYHPSDEEIVKVQASMKKQEALRYLSETDWYVTRQSETGTTIPEEVLTKRAQARIDASN